MQFSDTTNDTGLVQDIDFICGTDSVSYPLKDKARNMNRWIYKVVTWIYKANSKWQFDDSNHTDLPIITTTLVNSQRSYELPSDLIKLQRVEVLDNNGNYQLIKPKDQSQINIALSEYQETDGMPKYYDIIGNSLFLYPAPDNGVSVTLAKGLKLYIAREINLFVSTDTIQEPGFSENYHRIVSLGGSYDWLLVNGPAKKTSAVRKEIEQMKSELFELEGDKDVQVKTKIEPKHRRGDYI